MVKKVTKKRRKSSLDLIKKNITKCENFLEKGDLSNAKKTYVSIMDKYHKFSFEEKKQIYSEINALYEEITSTEKIYKSKKDSKEVNIVKEPSHFNEGSKKTIFSSIASYIFTPEEENVNVTENKLPDQKKVDQEEGSKEQGYDVNIDEMINLLKEKKWNVLGSTLLIVFLVLLFSLVAVPRLYESTSMISISPDKGNVYSTIEAKLLVDSPQVILPVIDKFFDEKENMDLDRFRKKYMKVELVQEKTDPKENIIISYLQITTKADSPLKAKQINEEIIKNFFSYVEPIYERSVNFTLEKMNHKEKEISKLEFYFEKLKNTIDMIEERESRYQTVEDVNRNLKESYFALGSGAAIEELNLTSDMISEGLGEYRFREGLSKMMIRVLTDTRTYLNVEGNYHLDLTRKLIESRKRLSIINIERIELKKELIKKKKEYTVLSEPHFNLDKSIKSESESVIRLREGLVGDQEKKKEYFIVEAKTLIKSSTVLMPVIEEFFEKKDKMDLERFNKNYLTIDLIEEQINTRENLIISYLKISIIAESPLRAQQINEKIIEGFLEYVKPYRDKNVNIILDKIEFKEYEILELESEIASIEDELFNRSKIKLIPLSFLKGLLPSFNKRLSEARFEKKDLELELNEKEKYEIVSEPQLSLESNRNILLNLIISFLFGIFISSIMVVYYYSDGKMF
jgi:hypothetical protein